ncbi:helix-turn-helix transcriptional regulator [Nonomuraea sp. SMC257]|uniref:Helix-turn-helix transcriptional regulator n=1 Tax=Nonomuraea montanisoli TaxID=2741721 RepID=A0A7Y6IHV7_9ACTN|nr:TetR/AcrR family transcriptional regulator [Nonomuraea montanisoli]NUW38442.1 helix-turn-helix transcriptional regulator [Nonomuraea montanisoli]
MDTDAPRRRRADAARNAERITRTARAAFAEAGGGVTLEEIAQRAGVGLATLYRHFPSKEKLVREIVEELMREEIEPAIARALAEPDPLRGMSVMMETVLALASGQPGILATAKDAGALTADLAPRFIQPLTRLMRNAQAAGQARADLEPDDLLRILGMLLSTLRPAEGPDEGWRRSLVLLLDALRPEGATPLPPAAPPAHC